MVECAGESREESRHVIGCHTLMRCDSPGALQADATLQCLEDGKESRIEAVKNGERWVYAYLETVR
jgi:hypothetical protein